MVNYSTKLKSPQPLLFLAAGIVAAYLMPLRDWPGFALFGIALGVVGALVFRSSTVRTFEPADAPATEKRKVVAIFGIFKLVIGMLLILIGAFALADWLAPIFTVAGGYVVGSTAVTPLRIKDFA